MLIDSFVWLPAVVDKLATKHAVMPQEVESVYFGRVRYRFHEKGRVRGEDMYTAMGQTDSGRYLIVFFLVRQNNEALIVSARDMTDGERRRYEQK